MKESVNKLIANLHVFIILYALYGVWASYDEYSVQMTSVNDEVSRLESELVSATKKIQEIEEFSKKTEEYKVRVESVAKNIEEVQKQLPSETNDSQIMSYLSSEMNNLNIKDPNVSSGKEESSTYFISKEYNLKMKGTYLQFLILLERIGNAERIYNIKSLKMIASNEPKKGRYQLIETEGIIQAYRFNPDFKVDRGFDQIEKVK